MGKLMTRVVLVATLAAAGCRTPAPPPPAPPPPPPPPTTSACTTVTGDTATVNVDYKAIADPECVRIKQGKTTIRWQGGLDVDSLRVEFKPGVDVPPNPVCTANECVLEKAKHATKKGDFAYTVTVVTKGTTVVVDPRVIIDPAP